MAISYKTAGVDIQAGDETVNRIKPLVRKTFNQNVLTDIGLFGGFYDARFPEYKHPILVASTDGVGTKLKIAFLTNKHTTVGQCLVNHCVNDILCCGAKPLFFLDYFATGKLEPEIAEQVISGFVTACQENGCALIGGETAEMPSLYSEGEYDVSGTIVGIVEKDSIVDGKSIKTADVLIGLRSTGLHTNGYSLARAVLLSEFTVDSKVPELSGTIGEELLSVHQSYLHIVSPLLENKLLKGISHITGGGIIGNTKRIVPKGLSLEIDWNSWQLPPIFQLIQKVGKIDDEEMRNVFNLGIGMILVVAQNDVDNCLEILKDEKPIVIGKIM
ncbi:MAG TPA: phosphoribosylformylglycinamidine cyclo-ligase [Candidatus Kapabacteria bacterium]|nr:phosphoribosylformylglycinamidine cyclo-ligase [Candidatus Kapabacteria bacterium]HPO64043.1 phosphoribosylformylglycinamidine cyclo-ligase [Candidatus Kapabacteria bacterium]